MLPRFQTSSGKTYDSATPYDKSIAYYGGLANGIYPQMLDVISQSPKMGDYDVNMDGLLSTLLLYDTAELYDLAQRYEEPGVSGYTGGFKPQISNAYDPKPQIGYML